MDVAGENEWREWKAGEGGRQVKGLGSVAEGERRWMLGRSRLSHGWAWMR